MRQLAILIFSNPGSPTNLLFILRPVFKSFDYPHRRLKSALVGAWKRRRPLSTALHILVGHQHVVGWRVVLIYTRTPPTHQSLEFSGRAAYMETHLQPLGQCLVATLQISSFLHSVATHSVLEHKLKSLYSLIGDFSTIWILIEDFKVDIVFSAGFDYDIDAYYIQKYIYSSCMNM